MINNYDFNTTIRLSATFKNDVGNLIDPTSVSLKYICLDEETNFEFSYPSDITKESIGKYHLDINPASAGFWRYRWSGFGTVQVSKIGEFTVNSGL